MEKAYGANVKPQPKEGDYAGIAKRMLQSTLSVLCDFRVNKYFRTEFIVYIASFYCWV